MTQFSIHHGRPGTLWALASCVVALQVHAQDSAQARLPTVQLAAGMHLIQAEVAQSANQHSVGLMHRRSMGANEGMLFEYEQPQVHCFWMRNTLLPLTIAFVDDGGRIVNLADMQPLKEDSHCSAKPVRYALEMHQGWFAKRGIKAGFKLSGAPFDATAPAR